MPVTMRRTSDCEVAAMATATGKTYEEVYRAEGRKELSSGLNDPIWGNPETLYLTLIKLGFWKRNITWSDLENQRAKPGKTIILIHDPTHPILTQHYVVLSGYYPGGFQCYWGYPITPNHDPQNPVNVEREKMKDLFLKGWPNCCFEVTTDTAWLRFKRWLGIEK